MVQPINLIFRFLQSRATVQIWLYDQQSLRIEGKITGFDEFMNLVLDDAVHVVKKKSDPVEKRTNLGRIMLKGENITLIRPLNA
jgi:small nuclear ribonucleoprotein E